MSLGGRPKEVEQHSYRAAKQLLPGRPPKLIHTLTPSSRHLTHRDAATWCARPSRPRVAGPSPTALHPAVLALMRGCMPNTACPGPAHADYSASRLSDSSPSRGLPLLLPSVRHRLSDSSPSRGLPLLLPFVRHRLSDSSPFRGLPLSALVRHQRSVSSATRPFLPFVRHQRSFSSASRGWLAPLLPIHGTAAARGSGGATALPHLVQAPGTECALQLARCASGSCTVYSVSLYASAICPLSGCTSAPYSGSSDRCMGPLRMA